ncbi:T9SS type A sorting domain-containing protein [Taibaiella koreensis]|uniref:T9SS type A sorting domain-containing protein n=1 Tax=Taibaiella koreensis TaxID=1268548 RepID=UPI000E59D666|nr:T9SS type A sorting domain-containing protein [Taibaiella koreensis]
MKRLAFLIAMGGMATVTRAQLATGSAGLLIKAGTPLASQGLVLTPATDLTLQNDTIRLSNTPTTAGSGSSIARVYTISPSLTFSGMAGIHYAAPELGVNQEGTLSMINASPGGGFLRFNSTASTNNTYYVYSSGMPTIVLNRITATSTSIPLPVHYRDFAAAPGSSCSIQLIWHADGAQPGNFQIERSTDGKSFSAIQASVLQTGNLFSLTDLSPLPGMNSYRLAISEQGRAALYSQVITATSPCQRAGETKIYPNPAGASVTVTLSQVPQGMATIELLGMDGRLLKTFHTAVQNCILGLQDIAPGSYCLKIGNGVSNESIKLVKQ